MPDYERCRNCYKMIETATGVAYTAPRVDDGELEDTCVESVIAAIIKCDNEGKKCRDENVRIGLESLLKS